MLQFDLINYCGFLHVCVVSFGLKITFTNVSEVDVQKVEIQRQCNFTEMLINKID